MRISTRDQRRPSSQPGTGKPTQGGRRRNDRRGREDDHGAGGGALSEPDPYRAARTDGARVTMSSEGNGSGEMHDRIIDVPIESLPFIDEHYIEIAAKPDEVWDALLRAVSNMGEGRKGAPISKALGCEDTGVEGATG